MRLNHQKKKPDLRSLHHGMQLSGLLPAKGCERFKRRVDARPRGRLMSTDKETARLQEARNAHTPWRKWGPYLSERQWGTVREDYSHDGNAWEYFSHDQARSRAYHWGEDGLAGISDDKQLLCFAIALWNGRDPILKERLFGLTNSESNHGEDVRSTTFIWTALQPTRT
jgi:hypothetical protein